MSGYREKGWKVKAAFYEAINIDYVYSTDLTLLVVFGEPRITQKFREFNPLEAGGLFFDGSR